MQELLKNPTYYCLIIVILVVSYSSRLLVYVSISETLYTFYLV